MHCHFLQVKDGGYDYKVNETVNVVTAKTTEIGQRTWGIMKGVMALASHKVEEYAKEGGVSWKNDGWQRSESETNGYYQEHGQDSKGWNSSEYGQDSTGWNSSAAGQTSSGRQFNSVSSGSWDDWDHKDSRKEGSTKGASSGRQFNSANSGSWDDWDGKDSKREESTKGASPQSGDSWAGWDDNKDDGFDNFYQSAADDDTKAAYNGKSEAKWTGGGFL